MNRFIESHLLRSLGAAAVLLAPMGMRAALAQIAPTPPAPAAAPTPALTPAQSEEIRTEIEKAQVAIAQAHQTAAESLRFLLPDFAALPDKKVSLDFKDTKVKDALKNTLEQAKVDYVLDGDIPDDAKVTVQVKDVQLGTALDILAQSAGLGWRAETSDKKTIVRVGKNVKRGNLFTMANGGLGSIYSTSGKNRITMPAGLPGQPFVYSITSRETRSSFTCPNCHNQITVVRHNVQPKCATCGRAFQADWKVCPFDGTKRPETKDDWHFCPICGKPISLDDPALRPDKADAARHTWIRIFGGDDEEEDATKVSFPLMPALPAPVQIL